MRKTLQIGSFLLMTVIIGLDFSIAPNQNWIVAQDAGLIVILIAFVSLSFGLGLIAGNALLNRSEAQASDRTDQDHQETAPFFSSDSEVTTQLHQQAPIIIDTQSIEDPETSLWLCRIQSQGIFFD